MGSSDTEVNAVTVMAWPIPSMLAVTTAIPVAKRPATRRKSRLSTFVIARRPVAAARAPWRDPWHAPRPRRDLGRERRPGDAQARPARLPPRTPHPGRAQQAAPHDKNAKPQCRQRDRASARAELETADHALHRAEQKQQRVG